MGDLGPDDGAAPTLRTVRGGGRWVTALGDGWLVADDRKVRRLDARGTVRATHAGGGPITVGRGRVWVHEAHAQIVELDPDTLRPVGRDPLPIEAWSIAAAGRELLASQRDGVVAIDPDTGGRRRLCAPAHHLAGADDGRWVAAGSDGSWLGGPEIDDVVAVAESGPAAVGDRFAVGGTLIDADGTPVCAFGRGSPCTDGRAWALLRDRELWWVDPAPPEHRGPVGDVRALVASDTWLAAADGTGIVTVYDTDGAVVRGLEVGASMESALAVVGDELWVAVGRLIHRWAPLTGRRLGVLAGFRWVHALRVARDGRVVVSDHHQVVVVGPGGDRAVVGPWRAAGGGEATVVDAELADDGTSLAVALQGEPMRWLPGDTVDDLPEAGRVIAVGPDRFVVGARHGSCTVAGGERDGLVPPLSDGLRVGDGVVWRTETEAGLRAGGHPVWSSAFHDPIAALAVRRQTLWTGSRHGRITERDLADGVRRRVLPAGGNERVTGIALRGDVLVAVDAWRIHVWQIGERIERRAVFDASPSRPEPRTRAEAVDVDAWSGLQAVELGDWGIAVHGRRSMRWTSVAAIGVDRPQVLEVSAVRGADDGSVVLEESWDGLRVVRWDGSVAVEVSRDHHRNRWAELDGRRLVDGWADDGRSEVTVWSVLDGTRVGTLRLDRELGAIGLDAGAVVGEARDGPTFRWHPDEDTVSPWIAGPLGHHWSSRGGRGLTWQTGGPARRVGPVGEPEGEPEVALHGPRSVYTAGALADGGRVALGDLYGAIDLFGVDGQRIATLHTASDGRWWVT